MFYHFSSPSFIFCLFWEFFSIFSYYILLICFNIQLPYLIPRVFLLFSDILCTQYSILVIWKQVHHWVYFYSPTLPLFMSGCIFLFVSVFLFHGGSLQMSAVNQWWLAQIQCQQRSPIWSGVKKETVFSAQQLNYDAASLWKQRGCAAGLGSPGARPSPAREVCTALLCSSWSDLHCDGLFCSSKS